MVSTVEAPSERTWGGGILRRSGTFLWVIFFFLGLSYRTVDVKKRRARARYFSGAACRYVEATSVSRVTPQAAAHLAPNAH